VDYYFCQILFDSIELGSAAPVVSVFKATRDLDELMTVKVLRKKKIVKDFNGVLVDFFDKKLLLSSRRLMKS
jgi:hypothetical protein